MGTKKKSDDDALAIREREEILAAIGDDLDSQMFDRAVLLLVCLQSHSAVVRALQEKLGLEPAAAASAMEAARRHLARVAGYDAVEQLGTALTRLNDLYARSVTAKNINNALATQKEINRLLGLARDKFPSSEAEDDGPAGELAAVRQYLEPMQLGGPDTPTPELARLAVLEMIAARANGQKSV